MAAERLLHYQALTYSLAASYFDRNRDASFRPPFFLCSDSRS
jgi:hypothetical protein